MHSEYATPCRRASTAPVVLVEAEVVGIDLAEVVEVVTQKP
jgi:hypothetical protein